jgi:hypothetical protein
MICPTFTSEERAMETLEPICEECKGTGVYAGLETVEACRACGGTGRLRVAPALPDRPEPPDEGGPWHDATSMGDASRGERVYVNDRGEQRRYGLSPLAGFARSLRSNHYLDALAYASRSPVRPGAASLTCESLLMDLLQIAAVAGGTVTIKPHRHCLELSYRSVHPDVLSVEMIPWPPGGQSPATILIDKLHSLVWTAAAEAAASVAGASG